MTDQQPEQEQLEDLAVAQSLDTKDSIETTVQPAKETETLKESLEKAWDKVVEPEKAKIEPAKDAAVTQEQAQEAPSDEVILPPYSFNKFDKEEFGKLTPDMQKIVARRMHEMESGLSREISQTREKTRFADSVDQLMEPYKEMLAVSGKDKISGLQHLLALNDFAHSKPQEYIQWAAAQLGVNLGSGGHPAVEQQQQGGYVDPQIHSLQEQVATLSQYLQQQENSRIQEINSHAGSAVSNFINATDAHGNLKHPYVEQLSPTMKLFLENDHTGKMTLEEAYERALYSDPHTRDTILNTQRAQSVKQQASISQQEVAKAKNASFGNRGSGYGKVQKQPANIRDAVEMAFDEVMGG